MESKVSRREVLAGPLAWSGALVLGGAMGRAAALGPPDSARLLAAAAAGDRDAVRYLLDRDPGLLHARDAEGRTAFALALLGHHPPVADLLRSRGYAPDLHESALALDWERFESLAAEAPGRVNSDHPIGGSAMVAAALGGAGSSIWRVYKEAGRPNERIGGGITPLAAALAHPTLSTAEMTAASLLSNGADPTLISGGRSPLHLAAERGSRDLVEMLVRKGAPVGARDGRGRTPADVAYEAGHEEALALLRNHREIPRDHSTSRRAWSADGARYQAPDLAHHSPLLTGSVVGAAHFDLEKTKERVERYPELVHSIATTSEGAVEACAHTGRRQIVDYLLEKGAPYSLPTAVMRDDVAWARRLLEEDPQRIHERGPHDFALLWYPVIGKDLREMAELLLAAGAEVERQHYLGTTALHFAAAGGQVEMAELLLEHGADVNRVGRKFDPAGQTPLEVAVARGNTEVADLLRSRGATS